jgi:hypothetical protein
MKRRRAALGVACTALALLASCATNRLMTQQSNPDYVGKSFQTTMVVAVTADEVVRRTFEDRIVAALAKRGRKGIPAYSVVGTRGKVGEAELRQAIARSSVDGVLMTRITRVDRSSGSVPGGTVGVAIGGGGYYGYYTAMWDTVTVPSRQFSGSLWTYSETRLFDAKNGALAWTGVVETKESDDLDVLLTEYINLIFDAMVNDRVL